MTTIKHVSDGCGVCRDLARTTELEQLRAKYELVLRELARAEGWNQDMKLTLRTAHEQWRDTRERLQSRLEALTPPDGYTDVRLSTEDVVWLRGWAPGLKGSATAARIAAALDASLEGT